MLFPQKIFILTTLGFKGNLNIRSTLLVAEFSHKSHSCYWNEICLLLFSASRGPCTFNADCKFWIFRQKESKFYFEIPISVLHLALFLLLWCHNCQCFWHENVLFEMCTQRYRFYFVLVYCFVLLVIISFFCQTAANSPLAKKYTWNKYK